MRLLLDTHAFLWWLAGDRQLTLAVRRAIGEEANEIFVSAASAWEIATKFRLGKLSEARAVAADVAGSIAGQGFQELAITLRHAEAAGGLPPPHKDPFDRMLIAQSLLERMPLVSLEPVFDRYGVQRLW